MKKILLITFHFWFMLPVLFGQLSGTYTIDPDSPASATNYTTINAAVKDITVGLRPDDGPVNGFGVTGPVVFNIADGDYNENLVLTSIFNSSTTNTITFQSASGDSTSVRIYYTPDEESNNCVVLLNNVNYTIFKDLTVEVTTETLNAANAVRIQNNSNNNIITNCILKGIPTTSSNTNYSTIVFSGNANHFNQLTNNMVLEGSAGFYSLYGIQNIISGNHFKYHSYYGVYMQYGTDHKVFNNTFTDPDVSSAYAIFLTYIHDSTHVIGNKIDGNYRAGIFLRNNSGTATKPIIVANNMIHLGEYSSERYGIWSEYSDYAYFYYNSINLTNNNPQARCLYLNNGTANSNRLQNNNFISKYGPAVYINTPGTVEYSDYNNFYSENYQLGYWNGWKNDLSAWKSATLQDTNSISIGAKFISASDLHTFDNQLDSLATNIAAISTDIDGETRDASFPDIGADEFSELDLDAELVSIDSMSNQICGGTHDIYVTLMNYGKTTLASLNIFAQVDGGTPINFAWNGSLESGATEAVHVGTLDFLPYSNQTLKVYCQLPNGTKDLNAGNDTISAKYKTALSGTYTIGGTSPDFFSLAHASTALSGYGVCGDVVFNIRDGEYKEYVTLNAIPGADSLNTVTFRSESSDSTAVTISSTYYDYAIRLSGADYVTFEKLTIEQPNNGNVVEFYNNAEHNRVLNCVLNGANISGSSAAYAVVYSDNSSNSSNTFSNNLILNGTYGVYFRGQNTVNLSYNAVITHNIFKNQSYEGISLQYVEAPLVSGNFVSGNNKYSNMGIFISYCSNGLEISGNKVHSFYVGMEFQNCNGTSTNRNIILNNFVQSENTPDGNGIGILVTSCSYVDVYHNSVNETSNGSASAAIKISLGSNINIANNIFSARTGYACFVDTPSAISLSDNNNYYSNGSYLGGWNGLFSDIESLRTRSGGDTHSWSVCPNFISDTNLLVNNLALNNNGMPLAQVTKDITGATRNASTPDIGAIEFDAAGTEDVAVIKLLPDIELPGCTGYYTIYGVFINNSPDTLLTCNLNCEINGAASPIVSFNGKLAPGDKYSVLVDSVLFADGESYNVKVWSDLPNGTNDDIPGNDTAEVTLYAALNGTYTLGGTSPDFESFTELANHLNYGGLCGSTTVNVRNGTYNEQIEIGEIAGSSADNHLTIQSESGNSDDVVLEWASEEYNKNYTLSLIYTDHISFNNMTFKAIGNLYGRVVYYNNNDSLLFTGNTFINENKLWWGNNDPESINGSETVYNGNHNLVESTNSNGDHKQFVNNEFIGGNYSLYLDGAIPKTGTIIRQNTFTNSFFGIYVRDEQSTVISENIINAIYSGIALFNINDKIMVSKNHIIISGKENYTDVIGISLLNCHGNTGIVSNNFVSVLNNKDVGAFGINLYSSYNVKLLYNNVRISNPYMYNAPFYIYNGSGNVINNNVFANFGDGYAVKSNSNFENSVDSSDYNAYYTKGDFIFYSNNYNIPTLDMLRFVTGKDEFDSNSVVVDPIFNSETDLHVNEISLNSQATPTGLVTDDIDGETRDLITPDIGADEFDVMNVDATVAVVNTREDFLCDNAYTVYALIRNLGKNTLTSGSVNWSANGVAQTAFSWTGSLGTGQTSDTITLGTYSYTKSNNDPFELMAWVSIPNGANDEKAANDTASEMLYPGVSGNYTIGKNGTEDFTSMNEALDYLNTSGGLCGPVVFNISDGTYEEYIQLGEVKGASSINTITFQSASGNAELVTIAYSGGDDYDAVVALDGCDHVIFNNLTIEQYGTYDYCMQLDNGADSNMVTNCIFQNSNRGYSIYSENWDIRPNNYNFFTNNTFKDGWYGIEWNGSYSKYGMGKNMLSESYRPEKGIVVTGNRFINQERGTIDIEFCDSVIIKNNYITNTDEGSTQYIGGIFISMEYTKGYFVIEGNEVILNNGLFGIYAEYANGSQDMLSLVANNFVSLNPTYQGEGIFGMYFMNTGNLNVFNNTVSVMEVSSSMYSSAFQIAPGANVSILNNIFVNMDGGNVFNYNWQGYYIENCDYNNYYTSGNSAFYYNTLEEDLADLATWKDYTGFDAHSLELNPVFASDTDMHLCDNALDNKGTYTSYVTTDIDGQERSPETPDIGADEFTSISNINLGETSSLCDAPLILDAGPVDGTYSWSTGETTQAISVTSTGMYSVSISSTCGSANDAVEVVQSTDIPTASFTTDNSYLTALFTNTSGNAESYMWKFGDGSTSTEASPMHLFSGEGTYTVMLKAVNSCTSDSVESDVVIHISNLEESDFAKQVKVYPNPSDGRFSLELNFENSNDAEIQVFDIAGNMVYNESYRNITFTTNQIDISGYPSGSYTLVLVVDNQYITHKLIIE